MSSEENTSSPSVPPGQSPAEPVTPQSLVTHELVKAALRADKGPGAQLGSWKCKDFTKPGDNYACVVSSVEVDYTQGGEELHVTYIVKLNPCRDIEMFEDFSDGIFVKEGLFYRDIAPGLNKCLREAGMDTLAIPKFFHAHLERKEQVIFLEDLRPQGFRMFDRKKGQDCAHTKLILKELARLHAASILFQKQKPETSLLEKFPFLEDIWNLANKRDDREAMKAMASNNLLGAKSIAESTPGYDHIVRWIEDLAPKSIDIMCEHATPSSPALTVLNHGDCWTNNLLFRYNAEGQPVEAILLDLQVSRVCDPGCDLNYFLYSSLNGEDRSAHLEEYLDTYYDFFRKVLDGGKAQVPFTRSELADNFEAHNMFGVLIGMTFAPIILAESEDVLDLSKISDDNLKESMEEWGQAAVRTAKKSPLAQSRFLCLFDDLIKQGKIPSK